MHPSAHMQLHATLKHDHARLERLFETLSNAVDGADQPTLARIWGEFESGLLAHLELEERYLLPAIEAEHPSAAEIFIGEHNEIRKRIAELGVGTDLHLLRKDVAQELLELLRNHAAWEDRTLYRGRSASWARMNDEPCSICAPRRAASPNHGIRLANGRHRRFAPSTHLRVKGSELKSAGQPWTLRFPVCLDV